MGSEINVLAFETAAKDYAWPVLPIIMADTDSGEIVYASQFASDIFGYPPQELLGACVEQLLPEDLRDAHSRWRRDSSAPKTRLMGVGRQLRGRKKDGSIFPVHIGLTQMRAMNRSIGVAFIIDLTGIVQLVAPSPPTTAPAAHPPVEEKIEGGG